MQAIHSSYLLTPCTVNRIQLTCLLMLALRSPWSFFVRAVSSRHNGMHFDLLTCFARCCIVSNVVVQTFSKNEPHQAPCRCLVPLCSTCKSLFYLSESSDVSNQTFCLFLCASLAICLTTCEFKCFASQLFGMYCALQGCRDWGSRVISEIFLCYFAGQVMLTMPGKRWVRSLCYSIR